MRPSERINRTYNLERTTLGFLPTTGLVKGNVTVSLELSPHPQYVLVSEFSSSDALATDEISSNREANIRLHNEREIKIDVVDSDHWHLGVGRSVITLSSV